MLVKQNRTSFLTCWITNSKTDSRLLVQDKLQKGNKNELKASNKTEGTVIGASSQPSGIKGTMGNQLPQ